MELRSTLRLRTTWQEPDAAGEPEEQRVARPLNAMCARDGRPTHPHSHSASMSSKKPATAAAAAPAAKVSKSSAVLSPMSLAFLVLVLAVTVQVVSIPSVTGPAASNKPYSSFQQFYPFYASEHSDRTNRQLHFAGTTGVILMFLLNPQSVPSLLFSAAVGYILCPMLIGLSHGLVEFAFVVSLFLVMHKLSTGGFGVAVSIPLIGYTCAWVGHFMFEHNRPATFIYPTYSLMGDFYMFSRIVLGVEKF